MPVSAYAVSSLLEHLYEAAAAPQKWPVFLQALAKHTDSDSANLMAATLSPSSDNTSGTIVHTFGILPESLTLYQSYFGQRDPLLQGYRNEHPHGGTALASGFLDRATYHRSEFYNDFARRFGFDHVCFSGIEHSATRTSGLGLSRSAPLGDFDSETVELLDTLVPHLRRAIQLNRTLTRLDAHRSTTVGAMNIAALSLKEQGLVGIVSELAEEILRRNDGLILHDGRLSASDPDEDARLQQLISNTVAAGCHVGPLKPRGQTAPGGSIAITRSGSKHPLQLAFFPYRSSELLLQERPCAIVLLIDPDRKPTATAETLQSLYGLTPAEGRLTELLLSGRELAECAEMLGNTVETARVRLKQIMRKTNVSRQSELIRLLVGFPNPHVGTAPKVHQASPGQHAPHSHLGEK